MTIGIELNGVLRNTLEKIQQTYKKFYIDNPFKEDDGNEFEYGVISDLTTLDIRSHLKFKNDEELYTFLYEEHAMEIFGHSGSVEYMSIQDFNDFYLDFRNNHDIYIVSYEIGKSKPASLFFMSKFGCLVENIMFYSESTIKNMWNTIDVLITANPTHLENPPENKIVIKYETIYNREINTKFTINKLKELKDKIKEIYD
jgi:hypothetical protein